MCVCESNRFYRQTLIAVNVQCKPPSLAKLSRFLPPSLAILVVLLDRTRFGVDTLQK